MRAQRARDEEVRLLMKTPKLPELPDQPCSCCQETRWYILDAGQYGVVVRCGRCHPPDKAPDPVTKVVKLYE